MALLGGAVLAGSLATVQMTGASAAAETSATYVVLAEDAASLGGAIAAVESAGGQVAGVNAAIASTHCVALTVWPSVRPKIR